MAIQAMGTHSNPIANVGLSFQLSPTDGSLVGYDHHSDFDGGTSRELLLADIVAKGRQIASLDDFTRSDGKMAVYVVLGPTENTPYTCSYTATSTQPAPQPPLVIRGSVSYTAGALQPKQLLAYWSGRPANASGQFVVEGYAPGTAVPTPFLLDVFEATQSGATKTITRVTTSNFAATFKPDPSCPAGSSTFDVPHSAKVFGTGLKLGTGAGTCRVMADLQETVGDTRRLAATSQPVSGVTFTFTRVDPVILGPNIAVGPDAATHCAWAVGVTNKDCALTRNEPEIDYSTNPPGFQASGREVAVSQNGLLMQQGPIKTLVIRLSRGQEYLVQPSPTLRVVLNRDLADAFGDPHYLIRSDNVELKTAAVRIDTSALPSLIDTTHRIDNGQLDVMLLPVQRQTSTWQLTMPQPRDVTFTIAPKGTLDAGGFGSGSLWKAQLGWSSVGLYDFCHYRLALPGEAAVSNPNKKSWCDNHLSTCRQQCQHDMDSVRLHAAVVPRLFKVTRPIDNGGQPFSVSGRSWQMPLPPDHFDGGDLWLTAELTVPTPLGPQVNAQDTYHVGVRAAEHPTMSTIGGAITAWLQQNTPDDQEKKVLARVMPLVACHENRWSNYCYLGQCDSENDRKPYISFDGGYGLFQLTEPPPSTDAAWDWVRNLVDGGQRLRGVYRTAKQYLDTPNGRRWKPDITYTEDQLVMEVLARYNGGHFWRPTPPTGLVTGLEDDLPPGFQYCEGSNTAVYIQNGQTMRTFSGYCYARTVVSCQPQP